MPTQLAAQLGQREQNGCPWQLAPSMRVTAPNQHHSVCAIGSKIAELAFTLASQLHGDDAGCASDCDSLGEAEGLCIAPHSQESRCVSHAPVTMGVCKMTGKRLSQTRNDTEPSPHYRTSLDDALTAIIKCTKHTTVPHAGY